MIRLKNFSILFVTSLESAKFKLVYYSLQKVERQWGKRPKATTPSQTNDLNIKIKALKRRMTKDEARSVFNASTDRKKISIVDYLHKQYFGTNAPPAPRKKRTTKR